jgi:preprotein translocase subunit YajC
LHVLNATLALLQQQPAPAGNRNLIIMVIYIIAFGLIAWLLLIRPQRKLHEVHQKMLTELKRGDEVMTEGGIIGTVVHMAEDRITIKSGETRLVVARTKVARRLGGDAPAGGTA